jgi:uncharacterized protein YdaU (DUF1376 family)
MRTPSTPLAGRGGGRSGAPSENGAADHITTTTRRDPRNGQIRFTRIWISDLLAETYRLSPAAMGAYMRIYAAIVTSQEPLRDDTKSLVRITGITRRAWRTIRDELLDTGVLHLVDGHLHDPRAQRAIDEFRERSRRNRGNVAHRYRVIQSLEDAAS